MLSRYKEWVKRHPGIVQNLDWLLLLSVWNPGRTSGGYEFTYEAYHAAVGLLSLWHQSILEEEELPTSRPSPYLWLDALEHVETLIELRGMHLEQGGRMSRYSPLMVVEVARACLKMSAWSRYSGHVFLRRPAPEDLHQFESELGFQDILASLERLRMRYISCCPSVVTEGEEGATAFAAATAAPLPPSAQQQQQGQERGQQQQGHEERSGALCGGAGSSGSGGSGGGSCEITAEDVAGQQGHACGAQRPNGTGSGGGCCVGSGAAAAAAASLPRVYGVRQYVDEQLGWAARVLLPGRGRVEGCTACGGAGGQGDSSSQGHGAEVSGTFSSPSCDERAMSGADCSTSPACTTAAAARCGYRGDPWVNGTRWNLSSPNGRLCHNLQANASSCLSSGTSGKQRQQAALHLLAAAAAAPGQQPPTGAQQAREDPDLHMGRNLLWLAELLHIWRPVVYVSLLRRYGRRSWRPWLGSLAVDLLSGHFHRRGRQHLE
ncbi:hypothetical protein Agub_g6577, partial [Astrephomene gubernaculifera]